MSNATQVRKLLNPKNSGLTLKFGYSGLKDNPWRDVLEFETHTESGLAKRIPLSPDNNSAYWVNSRCISVVAYKGTKPVAWAALFSYYNEACPMALGPIGVYTVPDFRHKGFAQLCVENLLTVLDHNFPRDINPKANQIAYLAEARILSLIRTYSLQPVYDRKNPLADKNSEIERCLAKRHAVLHSASSPVT